MKMKMMIVAALAAAQPVAATGPAQAADPPRRAAIGQSGLEAGVEPGLHRGQAPAQAEGAREDRPKKKRKSTSDKLLTGAAVVLGVGALAVGGLLVAIFVG